MFVPPESIPGAASARDSGSSRGGEIRCRPGKLRAAGTDTTGRLTSSCCPLRPRGARVHSLPGRAGPGSGAGPGEDTPLAGARPRAGAVPEVRGAGGCASGPAPPAGGSRPRSRSPGPDHPERIRWWHLPVWPRREPPPQFSKGLSRHFQYCYLDM